MSKIYGYKEKDVKSLYEFLSKNDKIPLAQAFFIYGREYGKSKGTVRNLYYAMAKKSREDDEFSREFLGGKKLTVKSNVKFSDEEEKSLIAKINGLKAQGYSVRRAVNELSGGDSTLALRYQNKYRNFNSGVKIKPTGEDRLKNKIFGGFSQGEYVGELKNRINELYDKLIKDLRDENESLKKELAEIKAYKNSDRVS